MLMLKLYNTLTKKVEDFKPINKNEVKFYACGPTVYDFAHIGNLRTYLFEDIVRRILEYKGYKVEHAMNVTDVGHLVGDGDEGEDKLEVGAKREGKSPLEIAKKYEKKFFDDLKELNILKPQKVLRATESIEEQVEIIKILETKGFTYQTGQGVFFNTLEYQRAFGDYGKLSGQELSEKKIGARGDVVIDKDKKNPADFALWFFLVGRYKNHILHWTSPWGEGFPGWHIECSAISRKLLGQPFDIHAGGVDHIGTHHTNEIAQSEAAFGAPLANIWMHGEFLLVDSGRMGKSKGNLLSLDELKKKGFSALDYRYMTLQAHYRKQLNFTWEALRAAHVSLQKLYAFVLATGTAQVGCSGYEEDFFKAVKNDLNIPQALSIVWKMIDDKKLPLNARKNSLLKFDKILGLRLDSPPSADSAIIGGVEELVKERKSAREEQDFSKADRLRKQIEELGFEVSDTPEGQKVKKKILI
ncbi:MAG: cysteine--tRNA ligase [Candidatus Doudnabacteria bacterium CG10_big_fil_rev_8_21_14_0_10_42_18]|uniref:Cysteine--tRNA ligase n=1 Tax=Candidatus Doudnabacteria bacterium CG10_big_fil_rev_8_21_14_0_10_42_18 TaxID=1974552 RepID=A0A2H0VD68_9BACT|nr:MAG: cysteine--tRNA ligase [Candidatus Doudnabacteria bacterium CG10_big_fil_rev_8_21_14_0_10_42_18]